MSDSMPWWAFPGNKVVCIDAENLGQHDVPGFNYFYSLDGLTEGEVYTVRSAGRDEDDGCLVVKLAEIVRRPDGGYAVARFRPLVSQDDNIELAIYLGRNRHAKRPQKADA